MPEIDSDQDVIDSRDVITRLEEIEAEIEEYETALAERAAEGTDREIGELEFAVEELQRELSMLKEFADDGETNASDWLYGATLIRDSYFEDYARELAESVGAIDSDAGWPLAHIDWEAAADSLRMDYTSLEFEGVTYWVR